MPIIRYKTGDIGRILTQPCPCGCDLPRLDHVRGRKAELSHRPNIHSLDEALLAIDGIADYTAQLEGDNLTIFIKGDQRCYDDARRAVSKIYPEFSCTIKSGDFFKTTGTIKRKLTIS
jgi:phenylacetate-coenzyme A ligase PaaK-like adenylate-forming protein